MGEVTKMKPPLITPLSVSHAMIPVRLKNVTYTDERTRRKSESMDQMGIESSSEEEDRGGQEEQSLISWMIRGSLSLAMNDTLFL
ncbi:hypothetical protein C0J52_25086 [Blattella germanica]|nr:hypothetical protein C0J52_25086 [Blattella germanica]